MTTIGIVIPKKLGLFTYLLAGAVLATACLTLNGERVRQCGLSKIYQSRHLSCAETLDSTALIRCWGEGTAGQIGHGVFADSLVPQLVVRPFS